MNGPLAGVVRVLLLEDSDLDAELIQAELRQSGIAFRLSREETRSGFERSLRELSMDLILSDFRLPDIDGNQALALAKRLQPSVPFIVISGAVGEETAVELLKSGATDFVLKAGLGRLVPAMQRALKEVEERRALAIAQAEVVSCNVLLEQRVRDRTRELSEKNQLMEEDLRMAHELQLALLPQSFPTIPRGCPPSESAIRIRSLYKASHFVCGDCFNVTRVSETCLSIFICDVMGHGVRAALVTAMLRALEEQLGEQARDPGLLLTEMNKALCHIFAESETLVFASACALTVDVAKGVVTLANAGHPSPLLLHQQQRAVEILDAPGLRGAALGIFPCATYRSKTQPVKKSDLLLLFTDGLFEVENEREEIFSETGLRSVIEKNSHLAPENLVRAVVEDVEEYAGGPAFTDDVCVVSVEIARLEGAAEMTGVA